jgi:hypothetical protein
MLGKIGPLGLVGLLVLLAGIVLIAWQNLVVAAGVALVLAGLGFLVYGLVRNLLGSMGMGGLV